MMAALSQEQLADFRADIGDTELAFGDQELNRLYLRTDGDYDAAVVLALEQLLSNAVKFNDYTANQSKEAVSQIFEHLQVVLALKRLNLRSNKPQLRRVYLKAGVARKADKPDAGYE